MLAILRGRDMESQNRVNPLITDIHNCWIMDVHNSNMDIHNPIMDLHTCITGIWNYCIFNYIYP